LDISAGGTLSDFFFRSIHLVLAVVVVVGSVLKQVTTDRYINIRAFHTQLSNGCRFLFFVVFETPTLRLYVRREKKISVLNLRPPLNRSTQTDQKCHRWEHSCAVEDPRNLRLKRPQLQTHLKEDNLPLFHLKLEYSVPIASEALPH
jgi:hypothetical protein